MRDGADIVGYVVLNVDGETGGIYDMGVAPLSAAGVRGGVGRRRSGPRPRRELHQRHVECDRRRRAGVPEGRLPLARSRHDLVALPAQPATTGRLRPPSALHTLVTLCHKGSWVEQAGGAPSTAGTMARARTNVSRRLLVSARTRLSADDWKTTTRPSPPIPETKLGRPPRHRSRPR